MSRSAKLQVEGVYSLPPLILHPFTESASTVRVLENARASQSFFRDPEQELDPASDLHQRMIEGRFTEFRMLYYVGKDVMRWLEQCVETCGRTAELKNRAVSLQSFAQLLIEQTPEDVVTKLHAWGVVEYQRIFSRSIGIYNQFRNPPELGDLQPDYLRYYYRYADYAYAAWLEIHKPMQLEQSQFPFTLYASGEYARMLEDQWKES